MEKLTGDGEGDRRPLAVFLTLAAVYWLFFGGRFHSADEESVLAVAESLVKRGWFDTPQRAFAVQIGLPITQETMGWDGRLYSKRGWAWPVAVAPFYALSLLSGRLGGMYTAYLASVVVTALSGSMVYVCGRELGNGPRSALWGAWSFGLGSIALVYSRLLFVEPFIGLCLLGGVWGALRYRRERSARWASLAGLAVGLACGARLASLTLLPVFAAYLWLVAVRSEGRRPAIQGVGAWGAGLSLPLALSGVYNWVRFGSVWQSGYTSPVEGFTTPLGVGLYGLLLSPGKGFFWFSPVLLLAFPGAVAMWRKRWATVLLLCGMSVVTVLTYAAWYMWWGGSVWGPRFLVPLSGPLALLTVPAWEWVGERRRWAMAVAGVLFVLSVAVQVLGGAVDFLEYGARLTAIDPRAEWTIAIYDWRYQPVAGHLRLLLAGHFVWGRSQDGRIRVDGLSLAADVAVLVTCVLAWAVRRFRPVFPLLLVGVILWGEVRLQGDLLAGRQAQGWEELYRYVTEHARRGDLLFVQDGLGNELGYSLDTSRLPRYHWSARPVPLDERSARWLGVFDGSRVWLAGSVQDRARGIERWLAGQGAKLVDVEFVGGPRLTCFERTPPLSRWVRVELRFADELMLREYARTTGVVAPGDSVHLVLKWEAVRRPGFNYSVFVHMVDADGRVYRQVDGAPVSGFRPMNDWLPGEVVVDRYGLTLPSDCPSGTYRLLVGVYRWDTLERLPVTDAAGRTIGDAVDLGSLVVERGR